MRLGWNADIAVTGQEVRGERCLESEMANGKVEQKATAGQSRNHNGILWSQCDDIGLAQRARGTLRKQD